MKNHKALLALLLGSVFALAFAEPPPLSAYSRLPAMDMPTLSDSGQRVAAIGTLNGKRVLMAYEVTGAPLYAVELIDINLVELQWAGENFLVGVTSSTQDIGWRFDGEHAVWNLFVVDLARKTLTWPLSKQSEIMDDAFGVYGTGVQDGRWYAYFGAMPVSESNATGKNYLISAPLRLMRVELESGRLGKVTMGRNNAAGWLVDRAGQVLANDTYDDVARKWSLYAGGFEGPLLVEAVDTFGGNRILSLGRTPGTVLYVAVDANHAAHYMEMELAGKAPAVELSTEARVGGFALDPGSKLTLGYFTDENIPRLIMFDPANQRRVRDVRSAFPGLDVEFTSWNAGFSAFTVKTSGPTDAGTYFLVDAVKGTARKLGAMYPEVPSTQLGATRVVAYKAADGLEMEGILTLPPGREPKSLPVVVLPHGGPQARDYPSDFDYWAQAYASRGYAVWQPNFRGSGGYGPEFRDAGFGEWGRKMQTDVSDGVAELAKQGLVDARRACIVGGSYGGYAALAGVTVQQGFYRCAVAVNAVSGLQTFMVREYKRKLDSTLRRWDAYLGTGDLDAISPLKLAARADAPVMLIHGTGDTVVSYEQSKSMAQALKSAGKSVELVTLTGGDHWLTQAASRAAMLEAAVPFVLKHNPP